MQTFIFSRTCVDHDRDEVDLLHDMIARARPITWGTFKRRCQWRELAVKLGYAVGRTKDLRIEDDFTVGFYASRYNGRPCYYIRWSAIEYIFLEPFNKRGAPRPASSSGVLMFKWYIIINGGGFIVCAVLATDQADAIAKGGALSDWVCAPASPRLWFERQRQRAAVCPPGQSRVMPASWFARLRSRFAVSKGGSEPCLTASSPAVSLSAAAAKAMKSMVRLQSLDSIEHHQRAVARQAYRMADAMLAEREKRHGD